MSNVISNHPLLAITVIGSFFGTVLSYIFPNFTNCQLCAGKGFRIGNTGLYVFIHDGWEHLIGNYMYVIPGVLLVEHCCNKTGVSMTWVFALMIINAFIGCMPVWFSNFTTVCGLSSNAIMLLEMGLVWNGMISRGFPKKLCLAIAIIEAIIIIYSDSKSSRNYKFGHNIGLILGVLSGLGFYFMCQ